MENKQRKNPRLKGYDYSSESAYFITICTKNRECIFGNLVGRDDPGTPSPGKNVGRDNLGTPSPGKNVGCDDLGTPSPDKNVGRDDHGTPVNKSKIHLNQFGKIAEKYINSISCHYHNVSVNNYVVMPDHIHLLITLSRRAESSRPTISQIVGVTKRLINKEIGKNIFQTSFNDHIIRDAEDYFTKWNYIENNPQRAYNDKNKGEKTKWQNF